MADTLNEYLEGKVATTFEPRPYYCPDGDFLSVFMRDEESYAQRVDENLTVFRSMATEELVGCKIKGVKRLIRDLKSFGITLKPEGDTQGIALLFLSASRHSPENNHEYYETFGRFTSEFPIADLELQPA